MYQINYWLFQLVRGSILFLGIAALLHGSFQLITIAFNLPVHYKTGDAWTSVGDFSLGMPVNARIHTDIPDSSVSNVYTNGSASHVYLAKTPWNQFNYEDDKRIPVYTDTIRVKYHQGEEFDKTFQPLNIVTLRLDEATVFVQPKNYFHKLQLALPSILKILLLGFIGIQVFRLLTAIYQRRFFERKNYRMVASMGLALISYVAIVYILESFMKTSKYFYAGFTSTNEYFRQPFELKGELESADKISLLILAGVILTFARAFQIGYNLQKDQQLTV